jgi:predicted phosphodiesterase
MTLINDLGTLHKDLLIFGGPYSNLQALEAIKDFADAQAFAPDQIICTGDIAAYCAQPEECIQLVKNWGIHVVKGNCEESLAAQQDDCGCGFKQGSACDVLSQSWYRYAAQNISQNSATWMHTLPEYIYFTLADVRFCALHGSANSINEFIFASHPAHTMQEQVAALACDAMLGGHCGLPFGKQLSSKSYWLNAGVIGMPANDGETSTWFMRIDKKGTSPVASWHRLNYDQHNAQRAMHHNKLPEAYSQSLETGLWPNMDVLPSAEKNAQGKRIALNSMRLAIQK